MKNVWQLIIIFLASTVLHWLFASFGAKYNVSINFMLTVCMVICTRYYRWYGYSFAFAGGIFLDFFGVNLFGAYSFTFTLCAAAIYTARKIFDFESFLPQMLMVFSMTVISALLYNFTGIIFIKGTAWHGFWSLISGAVFNSILAVFVFGFFSFFSLPTPEKFK